MMLKLLKFAMLLSVSYTEVHSALAEAIFLVSPLHARN